MKTNFYDITSKLGEPLWWNENGVPRYCEFNIDCITPYSIECALVKIRCQSCHKEYVVSIIRLPWYDLDTIQDKILNKNLHYGDPPNTECCLSGCTMNSDTLEVLQYWYLNKNLEWMRDNKYEIKFDVNDYKLQDEIEQELNINQNDFIKYE
jgi:hypothetical protein